MKTRYSKITGAFYPFDIDYGANLPADTIEVAQSDFDAAMARPSGYSFEFVAAVLAITPPPAPSMTDLKAAALAEVRALRASLFPTLAGLQSEALARGSTVDAVAIAAVQLGCRNITQTNLSACTTKAQIDAAFLAAWMAIVAAAPISVRLAFAELKK